MQHEQTSEPTTTIAAPEHRALAGLTIVVTRPVERAAPLADALAARGARIARLPLIQTAPPRDATPLRRAIARLPLAYDWCAFTSAAGVDALARVVGDDALAGRLAGVRVAAVGPATARRLARLGVEVSVVPTEERGDALALAMTEVGPIAGARVLIARAERGRPELREHLRDAGARVDDVVAYRTLGYADAETGAQARALARRGPETIITFTSPSTARAFARAIDGAEGLGAPRRTDPSARPRIASIGPTTSAALRELGLPVDIQAQPHTADGLLAGIVGASSASPGDGPDARGGPAS